ncbi:MAG: hypothetical protein H7235_00440 [Bdellovibrionaceae bacterium]|nr:hypothetical protein [Pseudobdellovibrionaceae bacterium]
MKKLTTLFFILFFTASVFAGECEPVDLDAKDGTLNKIPRHKQSMGTCYAHTIATLYDAFRKQNKEPNAHLFSSPVDIAYTLSKNSPHGSIDGGAYIESINWLNDFPPCPNQNQKKRKKAQEDPLEKKYQTVQEKLQDLVASKGDIEQFIKVLDDSSKIEFINQYNKILKDTFKCSKSEFQEIVRVIQPLDINLALSSAMNNICKPEQRLKTSKNISPRETRLNSKEMNLDEATAKQKALLTLINKSLDEKLNKTLPIGLTFCAKSLIYMSQESQLTNLFPVGDKCGSHAAVISGRRKNEKTGQCEIKIRNPWGSCKYTSKFYDCDKKNGDTWIPQNILQRFIMGVTTLEEKP